MIAFFWAVLWLIVAVVVTWRVTSLLARERGPFAVGVRFRSLFGVHHDADGKPSHDVNDELRLNRVSAWPWLDNLLHEIAEGITCMWCCSVWVGMAASFGLHYIAPLLVYNLLTWAFIALALSGAVILIEKNTRR